MSASLVLASGAYLIGGRLPLAPADPAAVVVVLLVAVALLWLVEHDGSGPERPGQP